MNKRGAKSHMTDAEMDEFLLLAVERFAKNRRSVRTTFALSQNVSEGLAQAALHSGRSEKELIDEAVERAAGWTKTGLPGEVLEIAQRHTTRDGERKTRVVTKRTIDTLKRMQNVFELSRDALLEGVLRNTLILYRGKIDMEILKIKVLLDRVEDQLSEAERFEEETEGICKQAGVNLPYFGTGIMNANMDYLAGELAMRESFGWRPALHSQNSNIHNQATQPTELPSPTKTQKGRGHA